MTGGRSERPAWVSASGRRVLLGYVALAFAVLYLPVAVLVVFSFNESPILALPLGTPTLKWYRVLWADDEIHRSALNSLMVAAAVVPASLLVGVPTAFMLDRIRWRPMAVVERVLIMPLMIPQLITGLGILLLLKGLGLGLSLWAVILGHTVAWTPIVVTQVHARLRRFDRSIEEAAMDLGADRVRAFLLITLPNIRSALIGSALLVFTLSFDEVAIAFILTGNDNTLPTHIWAMLRQGVTPEINAIGTITLAVSAALIFVGLRLVDLSRRRP